jgi:2'-5' RNA ligase
MARLFFALWPEEEARQELGQLARDLSLVVDGKPVPPEKIHLTLAFLGEVAADRMDDAVAAAAAIRAAPFALELDRVGAFRSARVAWAGASSPAPQLIALQGQLAANLGARGFVLEERDFAPHLTLARRIRKGLPVASIPPIVTQARSFALVRSETGTGRYSTLEGWPLAGG